MRSALHVLLVLAALAAPGLAHAHGREPSLGQIAFDPADPDHVIVRTTWGFITTRDHGETFTWQCAHGVPFDRTREDPSIAMTRSSALLAATYDGITRSDPTQCAWSVPPTAPGGGYVTDVVVEAGAPDVAWAILSPGSRPDEVHRSDDEGLTWSPIAMPHASALTDRIRVAPSDPMRIYTSGVVPRTETADKVGMVLRSTDRGMTWTPTAIPLLEPERTVHVLGVDPTDPDRVFARVLRRVTDEVPERLIVSDDGGETWATAVEMLEIVGFAISSDGQRVWAGSWDGGLHRSDDGGRTWAVLDDVVRVRCLAWRESASADGELWICADGFTRGYALGRSDDGGDTVTPLWTYHDVVNEVGCDPSTPVGMVCPMFWPDLALDLQLDGSVPPPDADAGVAPGIDGSVGPPRPTTCGCAAGSPRAGASVAALVVAVLANAARRARNGRSRGGRVDAGSRRHLP